MNDGGGEKLVDRARISQPPSNSRSKTAELLGPESSISLAFLFRTFGRFVGRFPSPFLIATAIILSASLGLIGLELRDNVRDGYTPTTSRSRRENLIYREFLGSEGDPVLTTLLMIARDNGSMHRIEYLEEAVRQWQRVSKELAVHVDGKELRFSDVCGHYCESNSVVGYFKDAYKAKMASPNSTSYDLRYPISTVMGYKLHLERNFFGARTNSSANRITNIEHVQVISMMIMAEVKTLEEFERLGKWELELFRYCREYTAEHTNLLELHVIGAEIVDTEMNKDAQRMTPYFIVGFSAMLAFVIGTVMLSADHYGFGGVRILFIAFSCALVPTFAIMTTLGLNNLLGNRTNSPMLIMPFLINGIGVNDAFLTLHAWTRQPAGIDASEKLARVLHEVGPSITTTTLTNVITFLIGWLSPTEEMSIFCMGCALALFFAYLFTLTFFAPLLVLLLDSHRQFDLDAEKRVNRRKTLRTLLDIYTKIICHRATFVVLILGSLVYWSFGVLGTVGIQARLDTAKILPLDTPIRKPNRLIEEYVWNEFYPVTVIINSPINLTDTTNFDQLVEEFESMPQCRGSSYSISWIRDYHEYYFGVAAEDFDYEEEEVTNSSLVFDYSKLRGFLANPIYKHHQGALQLDYSKEIPVRRSQLTIVFRNNTSWDDRIEIMTKWRSIVDAHPELNASVWNVNAMFVDQMLSLKPLAAQNVTVTLICMAIVCAVFIQNPTSVLTATLAILSIALGVTGYLSFWHLDLDPVTLCAVLVSIGMAVDFVAHTTYHYQIKEKTKLVTKQTKNGKVAKMKRVVLDTPKKRVANTLANVAWPMTQAGVSTLLCILPLVHLQNYLPLVFVKTIILVVIWGLFHGLVLLPAILVQVPLNWFNYDCNHLIMGSSSDSYDLDHVDDDDDEEDEEEEVSQDSDVERKSAVEKPAEMKLLSSMN